MKDELDILWQLKEDLEKTAKAKTAECDLLWSGLDVYRFGFKCSHQRVGTEIRHGGLDKGCRAYLLDANEKLLEELRIKDPGWTIAPYDMGRKVKGEPFDMELPITCRNQEFDRVLEYLLPYAPYAKVGES